MPIDVSIVLALHDEGDLVIPTVAALSEQARYVVHVGLSVELIFVLDSIDAATSNALRTLDLSPFANTQYLNVDHGSAALSRTSGARAAQGDYLLIHDGDDLMAYNTLDAFHTMAVVRGTKTILYPQWVIGFGERDFVTYYENADYVKGLMIDTHPFVATCFFHSSALESLINKQPRREKGEAFEDWLFNAEAMAKGYSLEYCPDTILFYRQRHGSSMDEIRESHQTFELPHNELYDPEVYLKRFHSNFRTETDPKNKHYVGRFPNNGLLTGLVKAASQIENAISLSKIIDLKAGNYTQKKQYAGRKYYEIAKLLCGRSFGCILILPANVKRDNIAVTILKIRTLVSEVSPILVITDASHSESRIPSHLSTHDAVINLPGDNKPLTLAEADHLILRTILAVASCSPIFAISGKLSDRVLEKYQRQLSSRHITYISVK